MQINHHPRLVNDSAETLHAAALEGLGVVKLGLLVGMQDMKAGRLIDVLPGWTTRGGVLHAVFPSRRGLLPAVRALIDFLNKYVAEEDFDTREALINE
ncbi:LysR substrate-binding domain-containing protein [Vreelandella rituensis]